MGLTPVHWKDGKFYNPDGKQERRGWYRNGENAKNSSPVLGLTAFLLQSGFITASTGNFVYCSQAEFHPACRAGWCWETVLTFADLTQQVERQKNPFWWVGRRFCTDITSHVAHQHMAVSVWEKIMSLESICESLPFHFQPRGLGTGLEWPSIISNLGTGQVAITPL